MSESEILEEDSLNEINSGQESDSEEINQKKKHENYYSLNTNTRNNNNGYTTTNSLLDFSDDNNDMLVFSSENYNLFANTMKKNDEFTQSQSVPPLNLLSEDGSIIEATESCKEAFDIDLRAKCHTPYSPEGRVTQSKDENISTHWNHCSEKLQKLRLEKNNSGNGSKSPPTTLKKNYQYGEPIMVGEDLIGRQLIYKKKTKTKLNFIASNKLNIRQGNVRSCSKTYGQLYKVKSQLQQSGSSKALGHYDLSPCPTSKMTMNDREYFQSDPVLFTHGTLLNDEEDDMYAMRYNSTLRLPLSPPPSSTYSQTKLLPNIIEPLFVFNTEDNFRRENYSVNQPTESYWQMQEANEQFMAKHSSNNNQIENGGKSVNGISYPTSASGVFRMGILQQAELAKAHRQFCHKYHSSSAAPPVRTRLHALCSPQLNADQAIQTHFESNNKLSINKYSYTSRNSYNQKPSVRHLQTQQRYTYKDYSLLPSMQSKSRGLGPDTDNDEYRLKLARKIRQDLYSEHIRKLQRKSKTKSLHPENGVQSNGPCDSHCDSSTNDNNHNKQSEGKVDQGANHCSTENHPTQDVGNKSTDQNGHVNDDHENESTCQNGCVPSVSQSKSDNFHLTPLSNYLSSRNAKNVECRTGTARSSALSKEDLEKAKAAEKRLAMLSYAQHVRKQLHDQIHSSQSSSNALKQKQKCKKNMGSLGEWKSFSKSDVELSEMLHRHEEYRKRCEEIQKSLRIEV
uniref:Uncharacterized protein n=1 Tax=Trichobilharzia regenti TaxID=157069 RepID=A0AA85JXH4_TRIRE|nr:unnamed protein product [Trichobilharzia regenti]